MEFPVLARLTTSLCSLLSLCIPEGTERVEALGRCEHLQELGLLREQGAGCMKRIMGNKIGKAAWGLKSQSEEFGLHFHVRGVRWQEFFPG